MSDFRLDWRGRRVKEQVRRAREQVLFDAAGYVREQANRTVPHEEGTLEGSGGVEVDGDQAAVYYDTEYSVAQHENTTYQHDEGRRAKWLELTLQERDRQVRDILARGIGRAFR